MPKFILRAVMALILALSASSSFAAERYPFNQDKFASAQSEGKSILIDISAPWCPTCAAQKPIIEKLSAEAKYQGLVIFEVDFDSSKDVLRSFGAQSQSTLIVFKGKEETARSTGDTDPDRIGALLSKSL